MSMLAGGIFTMFDISASALRAERARMNVHANNLANINTTHDKFGNPNPYTRKRVFFQEGAPEITGSPTLGVRVARIEEDHDTQYQLKYEPTHPDADENGYVKLPNVHVAVEMVDMMMASRAYEANLTTMDTAKQMHQGALRIIA
ncbi:MAG: flagellar basal body rod protein FlgC [Planctomycetota bacterium]|jgi:flagellar basal-body rod protein FlgC|nr:flagellar basal body rod protein FlgC [Planctomycetota bacterium]